MFFKKKKTSQHVDFGKNEINKLEVKDLSIVINEDGRELKAISDLSFTINKGEIVGLVGESGCGKTLTSYAVIGLLRKTAQIKKGSILLGETDLLTLDEEDMCLLRGKNISMIFQDPMSSLTPLIPVGRQIEEAYIIHNKDCTSDEARAKTLEIMEKAGLPDIENIYREYPHRLSGGMKQRVMIAMALINKPDLIIADEPTTALDVTIQKQILELLQHLNTEFNSMILLISHDLGVVRSICDRTMVMYGGRIVEEDITQELLTSPQHPYTKGLLDSIPKKINKDKPLPFIPGFVEALEERSEEGCPFAGRCRFKKEICEKSCPELLPLGTGKVRCHFAGGSIHGK